MLFCNCCDYKTISKSDYIKHVSTEKHIKNEKGEKNKHRIYICETCCYESYNKSNYNKHISSQKHIDKVKGDDEKEKVYECKECLKEGKTYVTKIKCNYDVHYNKVHNAKIRVKYICLACGEYIDSKRNKIKHENKKEHYDNVYFKYNECIMNDNTIDPNRTILFIKNIDRFVNVIDKKNIDQFVINSYDKENEKIRQVFNKTDGTDDNEKISELVKQNAELISQNKGLLEIALCSSKVSENNSGIAKKSMNIMTYALNNFDDAPPLKKLEGNINKILKSLTHDDNGKKKTEKTIEEIIIYNHEQGLLANILGKIIIKEYKKDDPKKQSTWASDVARLSFIVKDTIKDKIDDTEMSTWVKDKKGLYFIRLVIDPLIKKINDMIEKFITILGKEISAKTNGDTTKDELDNVQNLVRLMDKARRVTLTIKKDTIQYDILRFIAPHFNLELIKDKNNVIISQN